MFPIYYGFQDKADIEKNFAVSLLDKEILYEHYMEMQQLFTA